MNNTTTHFGFETIATEEKQARVRGVFDAVASRYDVMNDVMSAGLHRLWKREMVAMLAPQHGQRILDVAGGTGDIAMRIKAQAACDITICDINQEMLNEGINRAIDANAPHDFTWACADAQHLPFPDKTFDAYTIAFGIRNVTDIPQALREAHRVLKIGGRFLCLEFSHMENPTLAKCYDAYSFYLIPRMGKWIAKNEEAYRYLVESIRCFPKQGEFCHMIEQAGFSVVQHRNLHGGVVAIYSGRKL